MEKEEYSGQEHQEKQEEQRIKQVHNIKVRCVQTVYSTGERCKRPAIKGGTVCVVHGGSSVAAKSAAKRRLLAMVDPALQALETALEEAQTTKQWLHVARIAVSILDRAGFGPTATLRIEDRDDKLGDVNIKELKERTAKVYERLAALDEEADKKNAIEAEVKTE